MNIMEGLDPQMIQGLFAQGQDQGLGMGGGQPSMWEPDWASMNQADAAAQAPTMPQVPLAMGKQMAGDPSGFAEYGMTPPALPGPIAQMGGLMGLANRASGPPRAATPMTGNLMAYLQSLGV